MIKFLNRERVIHFVNKNGYQMTDYFSSKGYSRFSGWLTAEEAREICRSLNERVKKGY